MWWHQFNLVLYPKKIELTFFIKLCLLNIDKFLRLYWVAGLESKFCVNIKFNSYRWIACNMILNKHRTQGNGTEWAEQRPNIIDIMEQNRKKKK